MVICGLAVLLAERGVSISKLSSITGISRTTLTALANHSNQGLQFETLNKICLALNVFPSDVLVFCDVDISLEDFSVTKPAFVRDDVDEDGTFSEHEEAEITLSLGVRERSDVYTVSFWGTILISHSDKDVLALCTMEYADTADQSTSRFDKMMKNLPALVRYAWQDGLERNLSQQLNYDVFELSFDIIWGNPRENVAPLT